MGVALFVCALFIIVQSWRHRASSERVPLPLLLIAFALLFDVTVTFGRGGTGPSGGVDGNRFVMANLILLTGIVIYATAHVPTIRLSEANGQTRIYLNYLALFALTVFLVVQVIAATGFGLTNGRANEAADVDAARLLSINPKVLSRANPQCIAVVSYILAIVGAFGPRLSGATEDHLGEFQPNSSRYYRMLGPGPLLPRQCTPTTVSVTTKRAGVGLLKDDRMKPAVSTPKRVATHVSAASR